jgi:hypothetical protein
MAPLAKGETINPADLSNAVPERVDVGTGVEAMHTGTLIDELMKAVEEAEAHARELSPESELERWYAKHHHASQVSGDLQGVA